MAILGRPKRVFDLNDSDKYVGSYLTKSDVKVVLNVSNRDLAEIDFTNVDGSEVVDERKIQKLWYNTKYQMQLNPINQALMNSY